MNIGPGSIIGGYRIERVLGSGGMATVYLAAHPALPRRDASEVLWRHLAADPEFPRPLRPGSESGSDPGPSEHRHGPQRG